MSTNVDTFERDDGDDAPHHVGEIISPTSYDPFHFHGTRVLILLAKRRISNPAGRR
jgi:hypothetical protein